MNVQAQETVTHLVAHLALREPGNETKPRSVTWAFSGAKENRTPDLFHAMEALYQLSYSPRSVRTGRRTIPTAAPPSQRTEPDVLVNNFASRRWICSRDVGTRVNEPVRR